MSDGSPVSNGQEDAIEKALAEYAQEAQAVTDIERSAYFTERDQITQRLRMLAPENEQRRDLQKLADFVRKVRNAWQVATTTERNQLATRLIQEVVAKDGQVVSIIPRPEFQAFVQAWQLSSYSGGSDGIRIGDNYLLGFGRWLKERPLCLP